MHVGGTSAGLPQIRLPVSTEDQPGSGDPAHQARVQEDVAVRIQILDIRAVIEDVGDRASRQSRKDREVEGTISRSDDDDPFARLRQAEVRGRSEEHTSELQSLMRISYAVFCL